MGPASGTCLPELAVVNRLSPALIIPGRLVGSSVHTPRVVGCAGRRARRADTPTGAVHRRPVVDASCRTPLWTLAAPSARSARTAPRRTERTTHACSRFDEHRRECFLGRGDADTRNTRHTAELVATVVSAAGLVTWYASDQIRFRGIGGTRTNGWTPLVQYKFPNTNWRDITGGYPDTYDFIFGDALDFIACVLGDAAGWLVRSDRPVVVHFRHRVRHIASACRCSRQD